MTAQNIRIPSGGSALAYALHEDDARDEDVGDTPRSLDVEAASSFSESCVLAAALRELEAEERTWQERYERLRDDQQLIDVNIAELQAACDSTVADLLVVEAMNQGLIQETDDSDTRRNAALQELERLSCHVNCLAFQSTSFAVDWTELQADIDKVKLAASHPASQSTLAPSAAKVAAVVAVAQAAGARKSAASHTERGLVETNMSIISEPYEGTDEFCETAMSPTPASNKVSLQAQTLHMARASENDSRVASTSSSTTARSLEHFGPEVMTDCGSASSSASRNTSVANSSGGEITPHGMEGIMHITCPGASYHAPHLAVTCSPSAVTQELSETLSMPGGCDHRFSRCIVRAPLVAPNDAGTENGLNPAAMVSAARADSCTPMQPWLQRPGKTQEVQNPSIARSPSPTVGARSSHALVATSKWSSTCARPLVPLAADVSPASNIQSRPSRLSGGEQSAPIRIFSTRSPMTPLRCFSEGFVPSSTIRSFDINATHTVRDECSDDVVIQKNASASLLQSCRASSSSPPPPRKSFSFTGANAAAASVPQATEGTFAPLCGKVDRRQVATQAPTSSICGRLGRHTYMCHQMSPSKAFRFSSPGRVSSSTANRGAVLSGRSSPVLLCGTSPSCRTSTAATASLSPSPPRCRLARRRQ